MDIYTERAHLLAALSSIYPSHLYAVSDSEPGFLLGVCIHFPWGQASWHISDDDLFLNLFAHLLIEPSDYDGHTTEQKYEAMRLAILSGEVT